MPPLINRYWKKPRYVKLYKSGGNIYAYYRREGQQIRIQGEPGAKPWFDSYHEIDERFSRKREPSRAAPGSLSAAIVAYKEGERFRNLAASTRERYDFALTRLGDMLGKAPLTSISRRAVIRLQDKIAETQPRNAIEVIKVLNLVFQCAVDRGDVDKNPAEKVRKPAGYRAKQHAAWEDEEIKRFLAGAKPVWRRALTVALYTGLRRGDLIRLTRAHIKNGWIEIDIAKTDGETAIPIHSALAAELGRSMPTPSLMLIPTARGQAMNKDSLSHGIQKECKRLGIEPGKPIHGIRRNAIEWLLAAGCSVEEVMSITDQTERMVKYYAGRRHKRKLAESAILKLENSKRGR